MRLNMNKADEARLESRGWLDPGARTWCAELEARTGEILGELKRLLELEVWLPWGVREGQDYTLSFTLMSETDLLRFAAERPERIGSGAAPNWRLFGLYLKRKRMERGCALCPRTAAAVQGIPGLVNAGFSCLESGYHLKPHRGYDPTLYRTHLGLVIPPGDCRLRVGDETRGWEAGKTLMFDDTYVHEAWNLTPQHRFVLIVDTLNHRADETAAGSADAPNRDAA